MPPRSGYIVNNSPDVGANLDMAEPDALDFNLLGNQRYGVLSGCDKTVTGSSFTINVAQGVWVVNGQVAAGGGQVTLTTSTTNARFDLIVGNAAGVVSVIPGTPSPNPVFPYYDGTVTVFASVLILPGATPTQAQVTDKRIMVPQRFSTAITNGGMLLHNQDPTAGQALKNLFSIDPNGKMQWLNDTTLERTAAGRLKLTGILDVATLIVSAALTLTGDLNVSGDLIAQNFREAAGNPTVAGNEAMGDIYKNLTNGSIWIWQGSWVQMSTTVIPTGMTMWGMMPSPPSGWLLMNGQSVSQAASGGLWTMFPSWQSGGNLVIPDATNCFIGWGTPGVKAGNATFQVTLSIANLPSHHHLTSPTTDAGGSHVHTATLTPAGAHTPTTQTDGQHVHDIRDLGHTHPPTTPNTAFLTKVPQGTGVEGFALGNQDITLPANTGANLNILGQGVTNISTMPTSSQHDHVMVAVPDHVHTATVASGGGLHSHPITENNVGSGTPFDIRPPFLGAFLYIKT